MSAADSATEGGTTAALVIAALRTDVFDALTAKLGATTEVQRALLDLAEAQPKPPRRRKATG